jgi:branched-chain amino acid transport system substrate-binding protein
MRVGVRLLLLSGVLSAGCTSGNTPTPILLGHIAPSAGAGQVLGEHARQGIRLAVEDINQSDAKVLNRPLAVLHPVRSSDAPDTLQPLAIRLITVDHVIGLLGGSNLDEATRIGKAAQPYGMPFLTPVELAQEVPADTLYSVNCGAAFRGRCFARFAKEKLNAERVAVIVDTRQPAAVTLVKAFAQVCRDNGMPTEPWEYRGSTELNDLASRLKKNQPRTVLYAGDATDLGKLQLDGKSGDPSRAILFGGDNASLNELPADHENVYVALPYVAGVQANEPFAKKYQERYKELPDVQAALAYDMVQISAEGIRRAGAATAERLNSELSKVNAEPYQSLTGPVRFDRDHSAVRPLYIGQVKKGQVVSPVPYAPPGK